MNRSAPIAVALLIGAVAVHGATAPSHGNAASFAILGGTSVVNVGTSRITGYAGVSPGRTLSGLTPDMFAVGRVASAMEAQRARVDADAASDALERSVCTVPSWELSLDGRTIAPGVYCLDAATLNGTLILDAAGDRDAIWIFRIAGPLTTATASRVLVVNGGNDGHVFWQTATATLGTRSTFVGDLFAKMDITLLRGAQLSGRVLARGAVSLDTNVVSLCCEPIALSPATLPATPVQTDFRQQLTATGGAEPYAFEGPASAGLSVSRDGLLSGTPTSAGRFTFIVTATDSHGCSGAALYVLDIVCPSISFSPSDLPAADVGVLYPEVITAKPVIGSQTFTVVPPGRLPAGLTLGKNGAFNGAPTESGTFEFTVKVTDSGCEATRRSTLVVRPARPRCVPLVVSPSSLPKGRVGTDYAATFTATGTDEKTFSVVSGVLPPGLTLLAGGLLSGRLAVAGTFAFTVGVFDADGCTGSVSFCAVDIDPATCLGVSMSLAPSSLPDATPGMQYTRTIVASGGTAPYTFGVTVGKLPPGLMLGPTTGVLDGIARPGVFDFTITAIDANGCRVSRCYTLRSGTADVPVLSAWALFVLLIAVGAAGWAAVRRIL